MTTTPSRARQNTTALSRYWRWRPPINSGTQRRRKIGLTDCLTIRYDTVRDGQLNLAHGPETKNNEKIKIKNRVAQKKRCRQKSVEAVREDSYPLLIYTNRRPCRKEVPVLYSIEFPWNTDVFHIFRAEYCSIVIIKQVGFNISDRYWHVPNLGPLRCV